MTLRYCEPTISVIASPSFLVILRERSDRRISLRVNSAKQSQPISSPLKGED